MIYFDVERLKEALQGSDVMMVFTNNIVNPAALDKYSNKKLNQLINVDKTLAVLW